MNNQKSIPKRELRSRVRGRRKNRDGAEESCAQHVAALRVSLQPTAVVGYAALPGEPSLDLALQLLIDAGVPVFLPATLRGQPLRLGQVTGPLDDLPRGTWDIREPAHTLPVPEALAQTSGPVLILVPGLSYDARGVRLGNGGGFYDRTFGPQGQVAEPEHADLRSRLRFVGVCWEDERGDDLPREDWDLTVEAVLTEAGTTPVAGPSA